MRYEIKKLEHKQDGYSTTLHPRGDKVLLRLVGPDEAINVYLEPEEARKITKMITYVADLVDENKKKAQEVEIQTQRS